MAEIKDEWTDVAGNVYRLRTSGESYVLEQNGTYATGAGFLSRHAWLVEELAGERECHEEAARGLHHASEKNAELEAKLGSMLDELGTAQESLRGTEAVSAEQAREIARLQREFAESRGVWRLAVRELLRPTPELEILRQVGRQGAAVALHEAELAAQHQETLATLSKIAESAGWQGEEPLAEWLDAALTWHEPEPEIRRLATAHGFSSAGQKLGDFLAETLDRAVLFDKALAVAAEFGYRSVEICIRELGAHNSRIAHQHSEQVRSLDKKLVQEGQRITLLKVRFQELRDLVAEALEI